MSLPLIPGCESLAQHEGGSCFCHVDCRIAAWAYSLCSFLYSGNFIDLFLYTLVSSFVHAYKIILLMPLLHIQDEKENFS
jgi:hypothetical protein